MAVDDGGIIQSFNRAAERAFGWMEHEVVGQPSAMLMPPPDQRRRGDPASTRRPDARLARASVGLRRDGSRFPMELSVAPFDGGWQPARGVVRARRQRTHASRGAAAPVAKMDAMGQLAGGVAHDFNNLLTVINGWCETLASAESSDERRAAVDQIRERRRSRRHSDRPAPDVRAQGGGLAPGRGPQRRHRRRGEDAAAA